MYMNFYSYILFIPIMIISNIMILSSSSWLSMWMIMEINMISFISLILFEKKKLHNIAMNYFLIQSFNSYIFMFSSMMMNLNYNNLNLLMMLSMINKLGMPPFYNWYIKIMKNINWINIFFMSTTQKIIPLYIINSIINIKSNYLLNFSLISIIMYSCLISSIKAMNLTDLKMIMSFSSIIQMSWMLIIMMLSEKLFISYFMIYTMISMNIYLMFSIYNINYLNNLSIMKFKNQINYLMMMMSMFSLIGLPPYLGFSLKWMSINLFSTYLSWFLSLLMMMISLINLFFYSRIMINSFMNFHMSFKINIKFINMNKINNFSLTLINWLNLSALMMIELLI